MSPFPRPIEASDVGSHVKSTPEWLSIRKGGSENPETVALTVRNSGSIRSGLFKKHHQSLLDIPVNGIQNNYGDVFGMSSISASIGVIL